MIYEMRTYTLRPGAVGEFEARFAKRKPLREKHSKLGAFWHTELGTLNRQQSAALVGVAPLNCARGTLRGRRTIWGGRAHVRTVLSMGTRVATRSNPRIKALYERLLAAGKVKKVALTACMHTFLTIRNAMLKHRTPWQAQAVQG